MIGGSSNTAAKLGYISIPIKIYNFYYLCYYLKGGNSNWR